MKPKSFRQLTKELGVSHSYLSQVKHGKHLASAKMVSTSKQIVFDICRINRYNSSELGNGLAVGQRTLDLLSNPAAFLEGRWGIV